MIKLPPPIFRSGTAVPVGVLLASSLL